MPLDVTSEEKGPGILIIYPVGSIDSSTHDILQGYVDSILSDHSPRVVVFDMDGVIFISSMGVRVVLKTRKMLKERGGKLLMLNLRPQIKTVFDIIRALPQERIFANIRELDDYLAHMQRQALERG